MYVRQTRHLCMYTRVYVFSNYVYQRKNRIYLKYKSRNILGRIFNGKELEILDPNLKRLTFHTVRIRIFFLLLYIICEHVITERVNLDTKEEICEGKRIFSDRKKKKKNEITIFPFYCSHIKF